MKNFAIHDGYLVHNVVVAEKIEDVEVPEGMLILETQGVPGVLWTLEEEGWRVHSPYPSWVWNGTSWEAPTPKPQDGFEYDWNESAKKWEIDPGPRPYPSWTIDHNGFWAAPVPRPEGPENWIWDESLQEWIIEQN